MEEIESRERKEGGTIGKGGKGGEFVAFGPDSTSVNAAGLPRTPRRTH